MKSVVLSGLVRVAVEILDPAKGAGVAKVADAVSGASSVDVVAVVKAVA